MIYMCMQILFAKQLLKPAMHKLDFIHFKVNCF